MESTLLRQKHTTNQHQIAPNRASSTSPWMNGCFVATLIGLSGLTGCLGGGETRLITEQEASMRRQAAASTDDGETQLATEGSASVAQGAWSRLNQAVQGLNQPNTVASTSSASSEVSTRSADEIRNPYRIEHDDGEVEMIGVLSVVPAQSCVMPGGCGPEFSLLDPNLKTRSAALLGSVDRSFDGRIIAVKGIASPLTAAEAASPGFEDIQEALEVRQAKAVSDFAYYPFINEAVDRYTQKEFGCQLHWDKAYRWSLDGRTPLFAVTMSDALALQAPRPSLSLEFDGKTQRVVSAKLTPRDANPCHR